MKKSVIILIIFVILFAGGYLFYREGVLPVNKNNPATKIFIIKKGESLNTISKNLGNEELIRNKIVFYIVVKNMGIEKNIQAGDFRLSQSMDVYEIAQTLTHGTLDNWITVIEGLRKEEVAHIIGQNLNVPEIEFIKKAREGYLFPDTYLIPRDATIDAVLQIFDENFNKKYTDEMKKKAKSLNLTDNEVITLASLVEREARDNNDRQEVANILLHRIQEDMPLQIDATVQYVIGYDAAHLTWWKKDLSKEDLEIDSPYNTYSNRGLPPGPICSPGIASIEAVVNGTPKTQNLYYVSDKSGRLHFAKTLEEHNANIEKYLK